MLQGFEKLTTSEKQLLLDAPVLVTLLVGAADGKFDRDERTWSTKLVEARSYARPEALQEFYRTVSIDFLKKADALAAHLPNDATTRNKAIELKISGLNDILPQLDPHDAYYFYKSLLGLAAETAKASGGFLRIGSVSLAEYEWLKLPMLNPVEMPSDMSSEAEEEED